MTFTKKLEVENETGFWPQKRLMILIGVVLVLLVVLQIWSNNILISYGEKFARIRQLEENLKMENQILENNIAKRSSLDSIATASATLGLEVVKSIQYLH